MNDIKEKFQFLASKKAWESSKTGFFKKKFEIRKFIIKKFEKINILVILTGSDFDTSNRADKKNEAIVAGSSRSVSSKSGVNNESDDMFGWNNSVCRFINEDPCVGVVCGDGGVNNVGGGDDLERGKEDKKGNVKKFPLSKQVGVALERENKFFLGRKEGNPKFLSGEVGWFFFGKTISFGVGRTISFGHEYGCDILLH